MESAPTVRTKGCDNRKVARGAAIPQRRPLRTTINKTTNRAISRYRKILRADMESAPTVRTKGCDNRKVARGAAIPQRRPLRTTINKTTNRAISRYRNTLRADMESAPTPT